ncbi:prepilin-type N-terminal cleavage/methylation domain-containing protein [Halopseudomonas laoshanensis]|uniref:Type II secretion system protein H n=1 Tax=Halopseudomonas laoshanensis TaxID=2268758 RepID=A0A7V7KXK0_9GAMM|nr:GspH/FimT family pseudopilin [Halopseudomonas laoshanensis]KAA0695342.1 prepilin-type N-terminal cleavage/methylation domain-containing protein [Halopseudomonas laoshanensis]
MKSVKGFTLIELMVTIAVAAILIGIAVPSFRGLIISNRINTQATEIVDALSFARSESIKRNRSVVLCRAATAGATSCTSGSPWVNWVVLAGNEVLRQGTINTFNNSVRVTSTLTNNRVSFRGDGLARNGNAIITGEQRFTVCATSGPEPIRRISFGAASRVSVTRLTGTCS